MISLLKYGNVAPKMLSENGLDAITWSARYGKLDLILFLLSMRAVFSVDEYRRRVSYTFCSGKGRDCIKQLVLEGRIMLYTRNDHLFQVPQATDGIISVLILGIDLINIHLPGNEDNTKHSHLHACIWSRFHATFYCVAGSASEVDNNKTEASARGNFIFNGSVERLPNRASP